MPLCVCGSCPSAAPFPPPFHTHKQTSTSSRKRTCSNICADIDGSIFAICAWSAARCHIHCAHSEGTHTHTHTTQSPSQPYKGFRRHNAHERESVSHSSLHTRSTPTTSSFLLPTHTHTTAYDEFFPSHSLSLSLIAYLLRTHACKLVAGHLQQRRIHRCHSFPVNAGYSVCGSTQYQRCKV